VYTRSVNPGSLWPRNSASVLMSTPSASSVLAYVCRSAWNPFSCDSTYVSPGFGAGITPAATRATAIVNGRPALVAVPVIPADAGQALREGLPHPR
jgi:hypothetical protein